MILKFAGVGSAFAPREFYQTNAVLIDEKTGECLLIDCGSDARFSLAEIGIDIKHIRHVYITHLHADHVGGLEWLGFSNYFQPYRKRPILHAVGPLIPELWYSTLRGGMESLQGQVAKLETYFEIDSISPNLKSRPLGLILQPVQTVHVVSGYKINHSYGLMIDLISVVEDPRTAKVRRIFYTGDTQFCPKQIEAFYDQADIIFQDCETSEFKSTVHAHYDDLRTLPAATKKKMWLMHYQADGKVTDDDALKDGFAGFVKKGQAFQF